MMSRGDWHPGEEVIIRAIVDGADLSAEELDHFRVCEKCRLRKEALEGDLSRFTALAHESVPAPARHVVLEGKEIRGFNWVSPAFATVMALMVILAGLSFFLPAGKSPVSEKTFTVAEIRAEMEKNSQLLAEVMELEENVMPEIYTALAGNAVSEEDEFIDFVFPLGEEINGV